MNDAIMDISFGQNRTDKNWKARYLTWEDLIDGEFKKVRRTNESMAEYDVMSKENRDRIKNGRAFVGGLVKTGRRKKENVENRWLLTLDADNADENFLFTVDLVLGGTAYAVYSTHSSRPHRLKYRLVVPVDRAMLPDEHAAVSRKVADRIGMAYFDRTTFDAHRLMYLPSCSKDAKPELVISEGDPLAVDDVLAEYADWRDPSEWPRHPDGEKQVNIDVKKLGDPEEKPGVIGIFCKLYSVQDGIAAFIPDAYLPTASDDRWTYAGGSSFGGMRVYDDKWAYSEHQSDPANDGHCHNVFDLVRIHKFGHLDVEADDSISDNEKFSYSAMIEFAANDPVVKRERLIEAKEAFEAVEENPGALKIKSKGFALNDFGLGERFAYHCGDRARYCNAWKKWLLWDGKYWKPDDVGKIEEWGRQVIKRIPEEAELIQDDDKRSVTLKFAAKACHRNYLENMLKMAQTMPGMSVTLNQLDKDAWLLNCQNGTLDLRTGNLRPHDPVDMLTKIVPVDYIPNMVAPTFMGFLDRIFASNTGIINFVHRYAGYCLTGNTSEHAALFGHGFGANGKSTLLNILYKVLGDYAAITPMSTFIDRQAGASTNDIARLKGLRLVVAVETNDGGKLDEGTIKTLTGGDAITARFLYQEYFEFIPTFKFILGFNHKPVIKGNDLGIWRRIKLVPFDVTIPENEKDKNLPEKLEKEMTGILAWMVQGCMAWRHDGLQCPQEVEAATGDYRAEMDIFGDFLRACCNIDPNLTVQGDTFYKRYQQYCWDSGIRPISIKKVISTMKERGFKAEEGRSRRYFWKGVDIIPAYAAEDFLG